MSLDGSESRIQHMMMSQDCQLQPIVSPFGTVNFIQVRNFFSHTQDHLFWTVSAGSIVELVIRPNFWPLHSSVFFNLIQLFRFLEWAFLWIKIYLKEQMNDGNLIARQTLNCTGGWCLCRRNENCSTLERTRSTWPHQDHSCVSLHRYFFSVILFSHLF